MHDKYNMMGVLAGFPEQLKKGWAIAKDVKIKGKFENVAICGMGGSGISGDLVIPFVKKIPVFVVKDYNLPEFIGKKSLVIVISYSGNTEETLSCYNQAKKRRAKIAAITSGGKLAELEKNVAIIPNELQPRAAMGLLFVSVLRVLFNSKIISNPNVGSAIKAAVPKACSKEGFLLAQKMKGKIPVFYASENFKGVAYRCKTQVNENAKQPAFFHTLPEMNHNEINAFERNAGKLIAVMIRDKNDSLRIKKRMDITKEIIKENADVAEIKTKGNSLLARMLYTIYVGDYASYYLALMNNEDPTPVPVIAELKKRLME